MERKNIDEEIKEKEEELKELKREHARQCRVFDNDGFFKKLFDELMEFYKKENATIFKDMSKNRYIMWSEDMKKCRILNNESVLALKTYGKIIRLD